MTRRRLNSIPLPVLILLWLLGAAWVAGASSCGRDNESTAYTDLPPGGWLYGDSVALTLRIDSLRAGHPGRLKISLRHTADYPYSNLWLEMRSTDCKGNPTVDTIGIDLCDPYGYWYGRGLGGSWQITAELPREVCLDTLTRITVCHIMRTDTLPGISQVGLFYEDASMASGGVPAVTASPGPR